jgi:hypothetical protein
MGFLLLPVVTMQPAANEKYADGGGRDPKRAQRGSRSPSASLRWTPALRPRLVVLFDTFFYLLSKVVGGGGRLLGIRAPDRLFGSTTRHDGFAGL